MVGWTMIAALTLGLSSVQDEVKYSVEKGTGHCSLKLKLDNDARSMAVSPDGRTLALGVRGDLLLVSFETGKLLKSVNTGRGSIRGLAFSPDGKKVVAGAIGGIYAIDPASGKQLWKADGHPDGAPGGGDRKGFSTYGVVFSADGTIVVTVSMDGPSLRTWAASDGSEARVVNSKLGSLDGIARVGDHVIAYGNASTLIAYDKNLREVWRKRAGGLIGTVTGSPDGKTVAVGAAGGGVSVGFFKSGSGQRAGGGLLVGSSGNASGVAVLPDGKGVVAATTRGKVTLWKSQDESVTLDDDFDAGKDADKTLVVGLGGKAIAVAGDDDEVRIYRIP